MSVRASVVVPQPVSVVESNLWDVTRWSDFLHDVEHVRRAAHERYVFTLRTGRRRRDEVLVAVRWTARDHRFAWKAFEGPAWSGELQLTALNGRRTRVTLLVDVRPRTLTRRLEQALGTGRRDPQLELRHLQARFEALPAPIRPSRLEPGQAASPEAAARVWARAADHAQQPAPPNERGRTWAEVNAEPLAG